MWLSSRLCASYMPRPSSTCTRRSDDSHQATHSHTASPIIPRGTTHGREWVCGVVVASLVVCVVRGATVCAARVATHGGGAGCAVGAAHEPAACVTTARAARENALF